MQRLASSPSVYFLKWVNCVSERLADGEFTRTNHVLIYCTNSSNQITGFTFFEPRMLNADIAARLKNRLASASAGDRYTILVPKFMQSRMESLLGNGAQAEFDFNVEFTSFFSIISRAGQVRVKSKARVLCVDDSPILLKLLKKTFDEIGSFEVVGQISDPNSALEKVQQLRPDLITMDIQMPGKTGVEVVREIVPSFDTPILMVSSMTLEEGGLVFEALNSGAFDYIQKPSHDEFERFRNEITEKALAALSPRPTRISAASLRVPERIEKVEFPRDLIWLIGSSTGGTQALTQIMTRLPKHIPPVLIVQHIPPVFSKAFAESLNALCPFTVKEAEDGETVSEGHVYIAPGGKQMALRRNGVRYTIEINDDEPVNRFKPSVDYLLNSAASYDKIRAVAGILTGMGRDGAAGLLALKKLGARTFAQDEATSAVFGMPRAAIEAGAAQSVLSLEKIADHMVRESLLVKQAG